MKNLVIISNWSNHGYLNLINIILQLGHLPAGNQYSACIIVNIDRRHICNEKAYLNNLYKNIENHINNLPYPPEKLYIHSRPNLGMNIGAWNEGWRAHPDFQYYLFLQDEVQLIKRNWLTEYHRAGLSVEKNLTPFFLIGESWNSKWDRPWTEIQASPLNNHITGHPENIGRVEYYLECLKKWGVQPGKSAGHLRSLIWFTNAATMNAINGFKSGTTYGECIAAEIGASKAVMQIGGIVRQLTHTPFNVFWHPEWRKDGLSKIK